VSKEFVEHARLLSIPKPGRHRSRNLLSNAMDAGNVFLEYAIAAMLNCSMSDTANVVNGLSISPKNSQTNKSHNIIKLWNKDAAKFHEPADLVKLIHDMTPEDVRFTKFTDKSM
jgi:hypothetical protein